MFGRRRAKKEYLETLDEYNKTIKMKEQVISELRIKFRESQLKIVDLEEDLLSLIDTLEEKDEMVNSHLTYSSEINKEINKVFSS